MLKSNLNEIKRIGPINQFNFKQWDGTTAHNKNDSEGFPTYYKVYSKMSTSTPISPFITGCILIHLVKG